MVLCYFAGCKNNCCYENEIMFSCISHTTEGLTKVNKMCAAPFCRRLPTFGSQQSTTVYDSTFCYIHKFPGYISIYQTLCSFNDCKNFAIISENVTYNHITIHNFQDSLTVYRCVEHSQKPCTEKTLYKFNMLFSQSVCSFADCTKFPTCGYSTLLLRERCHQHKMQKMIDLTEIKCVHPKCENDALYYDRLLINRVYCQHHVSPLVAPLYSCITQGCDNVVCFTTPGIVPVQCEKCDKSMIS
jgi:hypothetical protein